MMGVPLWSNLAHNKEIYKEKGIIINIKNERDW